MRNSKLSEKNQIDLSPRAPAHVAPPLSGKKGVRCARIISGQVSDRYIWRYTQPSQQDVREAADDLWSNVCDNAAGS